MPIIGQRFDSATLRVAPFFVTQSNVTVCDRRAVAERNRPLNGQGFDNPRFAWDFSPPQPFCQVFYFLGVSERVKFMFGIRALIHFRRGRNTSRLIQIELQFHYPDIQFFL